MTITGKALKRPDLTLEENWVVVDIQTKEAHYYKTFREALDSPVKGHLMTEAFYKNYG